MPPTWLSMLHFSATDTEATYLPMRVFCRKFDWGLLFDHYILYFKPLYFCLVPNLGPFPFENLIRYAIYSSYLWVTFDAVVFVHLIAAIG